MVSDFMKGRYNLMKIFVGIDIAKLNHFAAAISSDGEILIEPFKFTNDADGFQLLVSKLESFDKNSSRPSPREDEEVLRLQAPELHALADSLVDSIFHNYLHDRLDYKKKERRIVAATIRKIHAPNQLAAVFDVSGSPLESSRSAPLRELSPL